MFCTACGNTLNEGDRYCSRCGKANSPGTSGPGTFDPPPSNPARPLRRFIAQKKIAGVAAGLGRYLDVNPVWIRLLFVALVFCYGSGLVAYLVLWLVMPKDKDEEQVLQTA